MNDNSAAANPAVTSASAAKTTKPTNPDAPSVIKRSSGAPVGAAAEASKPEGDAGGAAQDAGTVVEPSGASDAAQSVSDAAQGVSDAAQGASAAPSKPASEDEMVKVEKTHGAGDASKTGATSVYAEIKEKLSGSQNILIALSGNPSVDELAAAIGLSLYMDRVGKRPTAIYSGVTPNALQFLKPDETFESNTDALQDFVIALNKEKADHLRYKLDGEYVKIFITPYKTRIDRDDLEFSYGDYNVDLIFALNVANGSDLDDALREHGRIMHDATIIDVTTGAPGKLGEIEWCDASASSVSEMLASFLYQIGNERLEKEEATAFLTGLIAETNRFSNHKTAPETLRVAAKLVASGADPELVAKNITPDLTSEINAALREEPEEEVVEEVEEVPEEEPVVEVPIPKEEPEEPEGPVEPIDIPKPNAGPVEAITIPEKMREATPMAAPSSVPEEGEEGEKTDFSNLEMNGPFPGDDGQGVGADAGAGVGAEVGVGVGAGAAADGAAGVAADGAAAVGAGAGDVAPVAAVEPSNPALLDDLKAAEDTLSHAASETIPDPGRPPVSLEEIQQASEMPGDAGVVGVAGAAGVALDGAAMNPAAAVAPAVPDKPEINGVPEINYTPPADAEILPPPPAPPVDLNETLMTPPGEAGVAAGIAAGVMPEVVGAESVGAAAGDVAAVATAAGVAAAAPVDASGLAGVDMSGVAGAGVSGVAGAGGVAAVPSAAADPGAFQIPGM